MTNLLPLPMSLRRQLVLLARRMRHLQWLRGVSVLVLFLSLGLLLLFAVDCGLTLPAALLWTAEAILAVGALGLAWYFLARPLCCPPDARTLALRIEDRYPQLCERLTSSVALAEQRDLTNGAPAFVELLFAETAAQTQTLDVNVVAPSRPSLRLATAALAALLVAAATTLLWAENVQRFTQRLWNPNAADKLPEGVPHQESLVAGISLAQVDSTASQVTVTPPPYADPSEHPPQTLPLLSLHRVLQHGGLRWTLHFTRPVSAAHLELLHLKTAIRQRLPLVLDAEGKRGQVQMALPDLGTFAVSVRLSGEQGATPPSEEPATPLPPLTVVADVPPVFARPPELPDVACTGGMSGWPGGRGDTPLHELLDAAQTRQVPADDQLPLRLTVVDDMGIAQVGLEYRINHGPLQREALRFTADSQSPTTAHIHHLFRLNGKVKDGDVVAFRLMAVDNRRIAGLLPQTAYWPDAQRWFLLRIRKDAPALARQETLEQRDQIKDKVDAIQKALQAEREQLAKVQEHLKEQPGFNSAQEKQVETLRRQNDQITTQLEQLAELASAKPTLHDLAERARKLAAGPLHRSEQALSDAQRPQVSAVRRAKLLEDVDRELEQAQKLLAQLQETNHQLAKDRLDQLELANLAKQQAELARQAAELAKRNTKEDAETQKMLADLRAAQAKLAADMKRLTERSPLLKAAVDAARAKQAEKLAMQAQNLTEKQQQLTMDGDKTFKHLVEAKFADLIRQQQELAEKAAQLAQDSKAALAKVDKKAEVSATRKAAEALKGANHGMAVEQQGQAAKELERLADDLGLAQEKAADKDAVKGQQKQAQQLAAQQKELQEAVRKLAKLPDPEQEKAAAALAKKQADLAAETAGLMQQLGQLGKDSKGMAGADKAAEEAADATDKAATAMKQAQVNAKVGNIGKAQEERDQAVKMLGKAATQAKEAAQQLAQMGSDSGTAKQTEAGQQVGKSLQQGREQMGQAENKLAQGQVPGAQMSMQQAAQALQRAAEQAEKQLAPTGKQSGGPPTDTPQSNFLGASPGGLPNLERFGKQYQKYTGKSWGELPGELQTRLLQDLRARYGADYAELIQRYFEQLASPTRKGKP